MNIPAALAALETRVRLALMTAGLLHEPPQDGDVEVFNGPDANRDMAMHAVTIAAAFEDDQDAVSHTREERGAALRSMDSVDVACSVYAGSGEVGADALDDHRAEAAQILAAIDGAIAGDRQLGGTVGLARLASAQWMQGRDGQGQGVAVGLIVNLRFLS